MNAGPLTLMGNQPSLVQATEMFDPSSFGVVERRRLQRRPLSAQVTLRHGAAGTVAKVVLRDVNAEGVRVRLLEGAILAGIVHIEIDGQLRSAVLIWQLGLEAGLRFGA